MPKSFPARLWPQKNRLKTCGAKSATEENGLSAKLLLKSVRISPIFKCAFLKIAERYRAGRNGSGILRQISKHFVPAGKHDKERVFLNVIETGIFGKVYSILAPIADEIRRHRDISSLYEDDAQNNGFSAAPIYAKSPAPETPRFEKRAEPAKSSLIAGISKLSIFKKKEKTAAVETDKKERDPFSIALERSFGHNDDKQEEETSKEPLLSMPAPENESVFDNEPKLAPQSESNQEEFFSEPRFEAHLNEEERAELIIAKNDEPAQEIPTEGNKESRPTEKDAEQTETVEEIAITSTQKTLNELKKEWEDMRKSSQAEENQKRAKEPKSEDEDFAYPFGGWTDESNYK